jgi:NADPH-dependent glutamate synthase beta subunit-like oxidoreductase
MDVIIASRDQRVLKVADSLLKKEGLVYHVFAEFDRFVDHLTKRDVRLAIVDFDLGEALDFGFVDMAKKQGKATQFLALTGDHSFQLGKKIRENGFFYQIFKPVDQSEMQQAIKSAIGQKDDIPEKFRVRIRDWQGYREDVPCLDACPVHTDAGKYVQLIAEERFEEAYLVARSPNPTASICGKVCAAFCEDACRRGNIDSPITIRALKRFVTTMFGPESQKPGTYRRLLEGEKDAGNQLPWNLPALQKRKVGRGRKVAVVGAGPAGLACAHDLAVMGFKVTIFEASGVIGGAMRLHIPEYRLPRDTIEKEIEEILSLGIDLRLNTPLTREFGLRELKAEGYESVFLSTGAFKGTDLDIPGADLDGVVKAVDYLLNANKGNYKFDLGKNIIIVGGGRVALDAARTAWRHLTELPFSESPDWETLDVARDALRRGLKPKIIYRRSLEEMPAAQTIQGREELEELKREGIEVLDLRVPKKIIGENGKVKAMVFDRASKATDKNGRFVPKIVPNSEETYPADSVILAIGQKADLSYLREEDGLRITPQGFIEVDPATMMTSVPGIFAGGDAAFGPRTIIEAVSNGKVAAQAIADFLADGKEETKLTVTIEEIPVREYRMAAGYEKLARRHPPTLPVQRRVGMDEVELNFSIEEAVEQAKRCLYCHVETIYDAEKCVLCGRCVDVCPYDCLKLVPLEEVDLEGGGIDRLAEEAGHEKGVSLSVMIKDDDNCIRCGLCALRCPTGAMTMERFQFDEERALA